MQSSALPRVLLTRRVQAGPPTVRYARLRRPRRTISTTSATAPNDGDRERGERKGALGEEVAELLGDADDRESKADLEEDAADLRHSGAGRAVFKSHVASVPTCLLGADGGRKWLMAVGNG